MLLDTRTLFFVHSLVSITLALLMFVFWRGHRGLPGLGHWALGSALFAAAYLCVALRGDFRDLISVVIARGVMVLSLAAVWNGIRLFDGRSPRWRGAFAAAAVLALFLAERTYVVDDIASRIAAISAVLSLACLLCAYELARGPIRKFKGPAVIAAAMFVIMGLGLAIRSALAFALPPDARLFTPVPAQTGNLLLSLIGGIVVFISGLMVAAQRLQNELEARNADLDAARRAAEQASHAKSEFLAIMSHELRTPLNAILGFSDLQCRELLGPLGHPRYREYAADIHASGQHLLDLITTILDISKAEAGKLEIEPVDVDPGLVLEATLPLIRAQAEAKRIRIVPDLPPTPLACRADPQALKQILLNLLSNAVKFTNEDGMVTVRLRQTGADGIEIVIRDTGIGIAADDLPRLMKPFEQETRGYSRREGGTGLGLPLVDGLVQLHGGTLRIESTVDVGTTVAVCLPAAAARPAVDAA